MGIAAFLYGWKLPKTRSGKISFFWLRKMPQTEILVMDPISPTSCQQLMPQERVKAHKVSFPSIKGERGQVFSKRRGYHQWCLISMNGVHKTAQTSFDSVQFLHAHNFLQQAVMQLLPSCNKLSTFEHVWTAHLPFPSTTHPSYSLV